MRQRTHAIATAVACPTLVAATFLTASDDWCCALVCAAILLVALYGVYDCMGWHSAPCSPQTGRSASDTNADRKAQYDESRSSAQASSGLYRSVFSGRDPEETLP